MRICAPASAAVAVVLILTGGSELSGRHLFLVAAMKDGELEAILWHQGESDSNVGATPQALHGCRGT